MLDQGHHQNLWDRIWKDRSGQVVIFQMPNVTLLLWAAVETASIFVPRGHVQEVLWWLGTATLAVWALLEIFQGVNYFRRALGLVVLGFTIASIIGVGR